MAAITGQGLGRKTIGYDLANARHVEAGPSIPAARHHGNPSWW